MDDDGIRDCVPIGGYDCTYVSSWDLLLVVYVSNFNMFNNE